MFAVIKSGGRQYKVSVGETLEVNRLPVAEGEQVRIDEVLLISDADKTRIGTPFVENAAVLATVARHGRGCKVIVFKYKSKKRYRHRRGHRQELTFLTIDDVIADGVSLVTGEAPGEEEPTAEEAPAVEEQPAAEAPEQAEEAPQAEGEKKRTRRRRTTKSENAEEGAAEE